MKKKNLTNIPTRKSICNSGMVANVASFSRSFLYPLGCRTRIVLVFHSSGGILPLQSSYCVCCALVLFLRQQYSSTPDNERIFGDERTWQQQQQQQQDWSAPRADGTLRKKKRRQTRNPKARIEEGLQVFSVLHLAWGALYHTFLSPGKRP